MANLNKRMSAASGFIQPKTSSSKLVTAMAYSNSNDGMVRVVYDGEDSAIYSASLGTDGYADIPTIASIEASEQNPKSVNVLIQDGVATAIGYAGWGDSVQEQVSNNTSKTAYITPVESGSDAGLHVHQTADDYTVGSDLNLKPDAIEFKKDGDVISTLSSYVDIREGETYEVSALESDNIRLQGEESSSLYTSYDGRDPNNDGNLHFQGGVLSDTDGTTIWHSSYHYNPEDPDDIWQNHYLNLHFKDGGVYPLMESRGADQIPRDGHLVCSWELADHITESGTASTARTARTTAYTAVDATGWSYEIYASGKFHASAVVKWRAAMTTPHQGVYRTASDIYVPLPCQATRLTNVTFGQAMGGSSTGEVFCHAAGSASTWDGSATNVQVAFRGFTAASTASPSGDSWYYTPIDVWGVTE